MYTSNDDTSIEIIVTFKTTASFPSNWDRDKIIEHVKQNPSEYIYEAYFNNDYVVEDVDA